MRVFQRVDGIPPVLFFIALCASFANSLIMLPVAGAQVSAIGPKINQQTVGVLPFIAPSTEDSWKLPLTLNDSNLSVRFVVDSNFELLSATLRKAHGMAWLSDPSDSGSLHTLVKFPVAFFDMGSRYRNETLHDALDESGYPDVVIKTTSLTGQCSPAQVLKEGSCEGLLLGSIKIRDVEQPLQLPCRIEHSEGIFTLSGQQSLVWRDFHVEDPGGIFLRIDPVVTIHYQCDLPSA